MEADGWMSYYYSQIRRYINMDTKKEIFFYMNNFDDETRKLKHIFLPLCTKPDIITPWMGVNYNKNFIIQISKTMQTSHFYEYFLIKTKNKEALQ